MNFVKTTIAAALLAAPVALAATNEIDYGKANPPWKPRKVYSVVSRYEMELRNIVLDIRVVRPEQEKSFLGFKYIRKEKEKGHFTSSPFSGTYSCLLDYSTFATEFLSANAGSTFRNYQSANVGFKPKDKRGKTILTDANPGWFRRILGLDPRSTATDNARIADMMEDTDFVFREIFETDGRSLDDKSLYFLAWNQRDAFNGDRRHHMDVHKRRKWATATPDGVDPLAVMNLTSFERNRIRQNMAGNEAWGNWERATDQDVGYCVAQAEAKMMSYAIYGQERTRNVGDVWTIGAETLESFFPLQSRSRKPFTFEGGKVVLTVESITNGFVTVKSLARGKVEGSPRSTDLRIEPRIESEFKPDFKVDMGDARNNFVRFTIDSRNEICTRAEMQLFLRNYKGAIPKVEQLSLEEIGKDREMRPSIQDGEIRLHCIITTAVEDTGAGNDM